MRLRSLPIGVFLLFLSASFIFADGKFFSSVTPTVNIPDQSAVITFDGKTEKLIIDTAFESGGGEENLAWIVPLPAIPEVEKRSTGLAPTLRMLCQPRLIEKTRVLRLTIGCVVFALLTIWIGVLAVQSRTVKFVAVFLVPLGFALLVIISVRGCAQTETLGGSETDVTVYSREQVGSYDVATVSAETPDDLLVWLKDNEFQVDQAVAPVIESYIRDGWIFVAYKLTDDSKDRERAHPLSFTFPTDEAVYPIRLTGVGNGNLALDLYVLGAQEAIIEGMKRERTAFLERLSESHAGFYAQYFESQPKNDPFVLVVHDEFAAVSEGFDVLTKLTATLSPEQMTHDFTISWKEPAPFRQIRYTKDASRQKAYFAGGLTALVFTLALLIYATGLHWRVVRIGSISLSWTLLILVECAWIVFAYHIGGQFSSLTLGDPAYWVIWMLLAVCLGTSAWLAFQFQRFRVPIHLMSILYFLGVGLISIGPYFFLKWDLVGLIAIPVASFFIILGRVTLKGKGGSLNRRTIASFAVVTLVTSICAFGVTLAVLVPRTITTISSEREMYYSYGNIPSVMQGVYTGTNWDREREALAKVIALPPEEFRSRIEAALEVKSRQGEASNFYTGEPVREENSPGNYTIENIDGLNRLYQYDISGAKSEVYWTQAAREWLEKNQGKENDGAE